MWQGITSLKNLEYLLIEAKGLTGEGIRKVNLPPKLRCVRFVNCHSFDGQFLAHCSDLKLSEVTLDGTPIGIDHLDHLRRHAVRKLSLVSTRLDDSKPGVFRDWPNLEEVNLACTQVGDETVAAVCQNPKVKLLNLTKTQITSQALKSIRAAKNLEHLDIAYCDGLTCPEVKLLEPLARLRYLNLAKSGLRDKDLGVLAEMISLESLSVGHNAITDDGVRRLRSLPRLRSLSIVGTKVSMELLSELKSFPTLESVYGPGSLDIKHFHRRDGLDR